MTEDDRLDALLKQLAAEDYNRPPQIVPREAMWEAVQAGMREAASDTRPLASSPSRFSRSTSRIPLFAVLAIAAMLLLAAGIGIGRLWDGSVSSGDQIAKQVPPAGQGDTATAPAPVSERQYAGTDNSRRPGTDQSPPRPRPGPELMPSDPAGDGVYSVATVQHLAQVEALLTSFKADLNDRRMDAQMSSWAKELLSSTRLLLDSPAGQDVMRRKLLQDLELVLVQIVQLSPGTSASEREMIKGALTDDQVLSRLRTAIPAGQRGA